MPEARVGVAAVGVGDGRNGDCGSCSWFVRELEGFAGQWVPMDGDDHDGASADGEGVPFSGYSVGYCGGDDDGVAGGGVDELVIQGHPLVCAVE